MHCTTCIDVYTDNVHLNPDVVITPMSSGLHCLKLVYTDGTGNHVLLTKALDTVTLVKTVHSLMDIRVLSGNLPV